MCRPNCTQSANCTNYFCILPQSQFNNILHWSNRDSLEQGLYTMTLNAAQILAREPSAALSSWHLPCAPTNFAKQRLCAARRRRRMVARHRRLAAGYAAWTMRRATLSHITQVQIIMKQQTKKIYRTGPPYLEPFIKFMYIFWGDHNI